MSVNPGETREGTASTELSEEVVPKRKSEIRNPKSETNSKGWKFPKWGKEELANFFAACEQIGLFQCYCSPKKYLRWNKQLYCALRRGAV
jgi:hypothetical protein